MARSPIVTVQFLGDKRDLDSAFQSVKRLTQSFEGDLDVLANRMDRAGTAMTRGLTVPIVAGMGAAVGAAASFDSAMTKSTAIMGDMSSTMRDDMADAAREVEATTTFSATEAADAYFFLASAGLDAAESIDALPQVASFAQAGMFDLSKATDLATDAQSALGLTSEDAQENLAGMTRITDTLVKANTLANASVEQFATSLTNKAGAAMRTANVELEEGVAVLAALADQGLKGEAAGTALAEMLGKVTRQAAVNKDAFADLGIEVLDQDGNLRALADVVDEFDEALGDMSDGEREAALAALGLTKQSANVLKQLSGTGDAIRSYEADLREAGGTTQEVADKQMETLSAKLEQAKNRAITGAAAFGEVLAPAVTEAADVFADIAGGIADLPDGLTNTAVALAAVAAAAGPVLTVGSKLVRLYAGIKGTAVTLGLMAGATGSWTGALGALGASLAPAAPVLAGIGLLAAAIWSAHEASEAMDARTTTSTEAWESWAESMKASGGDVEASVKQLSETVRTELRDMTPDQGRAYLLEIGHEMVVKDGMDPAEAIEHLEQVWADAFGDELELKLDAGALTDLAARLEGAEVSAARFGERLLDSFEPLRGYSDRLATADTVAAHLSMETETLTKLGGDLAEAWEASNFAEVDGQFRAIASGLEQAGLNGEEVSWVMDALTDQFAAQAEIAGYNADGIDNLSTVMEAATGTASALTHEERQLLEQAQKLSDEAGITLTEALDRLSGAQDGAGEAADRHFQALQPATGATEDMAEASDEAADKAEEAASAHQRWADVLKAQVDPVFAVTSAQQRYDDALAELDKTQKDSEASASGVADAERAVAEAGVDLRAELARVVDSEGEMITTSDQLQQMLEDIGLPPKVVAQVLEDFGEMESAAHRVDNTDPDVNVRVRKAQAMNDFNSAYERAEALDRLSPHVSTSASDAARRELERLDGWIRRVNGRSVYIGSSGPGGGRIPEYHDGGVIGQSWAGRPRGGMWDERVIVGQVGEEVLSRHDPRHRDNLRRSGRGGGASIVVERGAVVVDARGSVPADIERAMARATEQLADRLSTELSAGAGAS